MSNINSITDIVNQVNNAPPTVTMKNEEQPILLVLLKPLTEKEREKLSRINGLRIFEINELSKNIVMSDLRTQFDLILLDVFSDSQFELLRKNYQLWQQDFNLTLYQRNGFSSDVKFAGHFETICKKLPLDSLTVKDFKLGVNSKPYISRPKAPWIIVLKKVLKLVCK